MIGDNDLSIPRKMLDAYALRHKLLANNIANAEVPGYRKMDVDFSDSLRKAVESQDPQRIQREPIQVRQAREAGVETETEVARMTKNEVLYNTFANIASFKLRLLRAAIQSK